MSIFLVLLWIIYIKLSFFLSSWPVLLMKTLNISPLLVMSLKRLLVGSISLSEDSQPDEENGEEQSENTSQEMDGNQLTGRLCDFCGE